MSYAIVGKNTDGKTPFMCSCGIKCNLEQHEIMDWVTRHSAHYPGIEHKLQQILVVNEQDVQMKLAHVLDKISEKMALQDKRQDREK